jgi:hypothetical protein
LAFTYDVVQFGNKNLFISGQIESPALTATGTTFYAPSQNGWLTAPVFVVFDANAPADSGFWKLSLDRQTLVTTIEYTDADLAAGKLSWTLTPDKCVVNSY